MLRLSLIAIAFTTLVAAAQDKKKKTPFDDIPGYKVHVLAGFTVIVHEDVVAATMSDMKRKPLECLELELKNVVGLMNAKAADALRKVPIWAEWDDKIIMSNGRQGTAYASYYGGNQLSMLQGGKQPLKAKCVTLHLTKELTKSYQEKERPETLVMLHELAHAVHDQLLGMNHQGIKAAYAQAMARKLYDKSLYIATNEAEFFAESSCAFLDRLDYVPKNRAALKEHDPETYKLLESIWGKAAAEKGVGKNVRPANGSSEFDFDITPKSVKWAKAIHGSPFKLGNAEGRVLFLAYVASEQGALLNRMRSWHEDYEPYGLIIVIANGEYNREPSESVAAYKKLNLPFAIHDATFIPIKGSTQLKAEKPGHGILFSATGECLFRGPIDDATLYVRESLNRRLLEKLEFSESNVPKQLVAAVTALQTGELMTIAAAKAQPFTSSTDATLSDPAKKLVGAITEPGTKALAEAVALKKSDPLEAFIRAEKIALRYKGLNLATKATALTDDVRATQPVQAELKARRDFDAVKKLETHLTSQPGSFEPRDPQFQGKHAAALRELKAAYEMMKKKHPNARATEAAAAIAREYGVE